MSPPGLHPTACAPLHRGIGMPQMFASWPAPGPEICAQAVRELARLHGMPHRPARPTSDADSETAPCGGVPNIIDAVVNTILSQHTTDARARRAIAGFVHRFGGDYEVVRTAPMSELASSIAQGGLGNVKSRAIRSLVQQIYEEQGNISLEHLRVLPDDDIKAALTRYKGIGLKTASCVLLLCLGRDTFAVDTHVLRVAKRLGWVPSQATCDQAHRHLNACIPSELRYPLHILFVRHGRSCPACAARPRSAPSCPVDALRQHKPLAARNN